MQYKEHAGKGLRWLALLLGIAFVAALIAHVRLPFGIQPDEYGFPALEFAHTHHISSNFLPIGYATIVGCGLSVFPGISGLAVANIAIYLVYVAVIWVLLQQLGTTAKEAFILGIAFALYPDILLSINKVYHSILTPLLLLAYASAALYLVHSRTRYRADAVVAFSIGAAMLCRSNLILFFPVTWYLLWRYKLPHTFLRAVGQLAGAMLLYSAITIAVHGSVFWPRVGAYVLFSGANEYAAQDMLEHYDFSGENAIIPALKARGIVAYHDWTRPDNIPGDNEIRNSRFDSIYTHEALKFAKEHPLMMIELTGIKILNLFRPDLQMYRATSAGGLIKILAAVAFPLWILLCYLLPHSKGDASRTIVGLTVAAFALPHLISVSAPHFRVPMDVLCFVACAAMLVVWRRQRNSLKAGRQASMATAVA